MCPPRPGHRQGSHEIQLAELPWSWLFGGVVVTLVIALFRGLPHTVSEVRAGLRASLDRGDPREPGDPRDMPYRP